MTINHKIVNLQRKLYLKSKETEDYKFYSLFDKIYRVDILMTAYQQCKSNKGGAGVDGKTFKMIEKDGINQFIQELSNELKDNRYKPEPVKRVEIPKANGKTRPLGIPTIRDRVVQAAIKIIIEPIYDATLHQNSYGYRPKKSAAQAVVEIDKNLKSGYTQVYDADLSGYFDTISHQRLMEKLERKISDYKLLSIIRKFLKAPIEITNHNNKKEMIASEKGTPQGGVISPLLANIYLNDFVKLINEETPCKLISFADDFVIMHKQRYTKEQKDWFNQCLEKEGLILNLEKTVVVDTTIKGSSFNFLGFVFKRVSGVFNRYSTYIKIQPSKKAIDSFKEVIRDIVKHKTRRTMVEMIEKINPIIRGWLNYFKQVGYPRSVFGRLDGFINKRFYQWAKRLSQRRSRYFMQNSWKILAKNNLILLRLGTPNLKGLR